MAEYFGREWKEERTILPIWAERQTDISFFY